MNNNIDWLNGLSGGQANSDEAIRQLASKFSGVANFLAWREAVYTAQLKYRSDAPQLADHQSYVAHRWLQLAEAGCLDVRLDPAKGLIVEETLGDDSALLAPSSDVIRSRLRKLLFKMLNELPNGRVLQSHEFAYAFNTANKRPLNEYNQEFREVLKELSEKSYIQHRTRGMARMELYCKGIDFDAWQQEMTTKRSEPSAGGHTFNFQGPVGSVQTGDHSVAQVQQSVDQSQFVGLKSALEAILVELSKANLPADDREEAKELVRDTIAEVEKKKPNKLSLKSLLGGVAATIQTLGSSSDAYAALKAAAIVAGITLP
ncbi:MAG: hypothetical protein LBV05_12730 [Comamonas sp.]|jgi:hypothetical protein|uniref:hypothetical protein n=1 Tax=Comamonas sp. TaxID=34028 RepID=UPI00284C8C87|nr:hypothetical protein [Comamonas sp.]MDR3066351.1 hypothetical protein [Comamonas sp.]